MLINKISHPICEKTPISADISKHEWKAGYIVEGFKGENPFMIIANIVENILRFTGDLSKHMSRKHKCENCNFK